jgi:hypothetical protein
MKSIDIMLMCALGAIALIIIATNDSNATTQIKEKVVNGYTIRVFCKFNYQFMLVGNTPVQVMESTGAGPRPLKCQEE